MLSLPTFKVAATLAEAACTGKALEISANTGAATDVLACTSVETEQNTFFCHV